MAQSAKLSSAGPGRRLLLSLAAVLLAHGLVLEWFAGQQSQSPALRPLVAPMYTRVLHQQAPPPTPVYEKKEPAARTPGTRITVNSIASASTPTSTATVTPPGDPAPEPMEQATGPENLPLQSSASVTAPDPSTTVVGSSIDPTVDTLSTVPESSSSVSATTSTPAASTATAAAPLDSWPTDTRLNYRLRGYFRGEVLGSARVHWQRDGSRYQTRVEIEPNLPGSGRVLTSQGEVTPQGLLPGAYEEQRLGKSRGTRLGETTIVLADGREVPRPDGVQDSASQFVELSHRFSSGRERLEVGHAVSLWIARPGAVDLWTFDIVEREMLKTAKLGEVEAFRLKPRPIANPRGNITAEMWFAPSLQYLPVRIRVSMGDEAFADLLVETIEQR